MVWCVEVWYAVVWYAVVRYGMVGWSVLRCGMVCRVVVLQGVVWYCMLSPLS